MKFQSIHLAVALGFAVDGLQTPLPVRGKGLKVSPTSHFSPLFASEFEPDTGRPTKNRHSLLRRVWNRLDAVEAAGLEDVKTAGIFGKIKKIHGPKTYLALSLLAGLKWSRFFRNPYYWLLVAFCVKWYRARYVFKIPVWDRQPNWNNIVTSKEQEKDLKAFTCKTCGSTIFIAKTREFFFEGDTGIGGLGCFSCGAKGRDNFVMDRDRIVEDVADEDDYFEYERPLDFVTRAERRKLMKETGGDESKANEILVTRTATEIEAQPETQSETQSEAECGGKPEAVHEARPEASNSEQSVNGNSPDSKSKVVDAEVKEKKVDNNIDENQDDEVSEPVNHNESSTIKPSSASHTEHAETPEPKEVPEELKPKTDQSRNEVAAKEAAPSADDDLDVLDMDAL